MGYGEAQIGDLEARSRPPRDLVLIGTPIDLRRLIKIEKPALRVSYRLEELGRRACARFSRHAAS